MSTSTVDVGPCGRKGVPKGDLEEIDGLDALDPLEMIMDYVVSVHFVISVNLVANVNNCLTP